jgi:hypothetical protein
MKRAPVRSLELVKEVLKNVALPISLATEIFHPTGSIGI